MPTISLSPRLTLHFLDVNSDATPTVLLLHGLGANGSSWRPQLDALVGAGYRVLAPDLRGFGRSSYPGETGLAAMARDVAELVRAVVCGPVHVAGISMGGTVALHLVLDHADLVERLVLVNTCGRLRPERLRGWLGYALRYAGLCAMGMTAQAHLVARNTFPHPHQEELRRSLAAQIEQSNPHGYMAVLRALGCFDVQARLPEIKAPTLVVTGGQDRTISPEQQRALVECIPAARQVVIRDAGHGITADCPEAFNRALLDFLLGQAAPARASCET